MKIKRKNSLSFRLLGWVFGVAVVVGLLLSLLHIIYAAYFTNQQINNDGQRILEMFKSPSTQALYSLDAEVGQQVLEGLLQHDAVISASIGHPAEAPLAVSVRAAQGFLGRYFTDLIFSAERTFVVPLTSELRGGEYYGELKVALDTAHYGERFVKGALIVSTLGTLRALILALVLYLVYQAFLTRPLVEMIRQLGRVNPDRPTEYQLPLLKNHEQNELGAWTKKVNELLAAIERTNSLRQEAENNVLLMSRLDLLTGLPNRQELQLQLGKILKDAKQSQQGVAIFHLGLDDFKNINDQYNYQVGDWLLKHVAKRLRLSADNNACLARLGGDQFVVVQPYIQEPEQAALAARALLDSFNETVLVAPIDQAEPIEVRLQATVGITLYPDDGNDAEQLLQQAEHTMQLAKVGARNRYQFFVASVDSEMRQRRRLKQGLDEAIAQQQLYLVYQPQVSYTDRRVVAVEALLRWRHPELGIIAPGVFIPLAEQSGQIIELGNWVLKHACQQLRHWLDAGYTNLTMAVNLSAVQLHHDELLHQVQTNLTQYNLQPNSLELEVTETGLMKDTQAAAENLSGLRDMGVRVAIDDFGTGYSSLSYLKTLPLDKLKIDKSFVQDALDSEDNAILVKTIIQLSKNLGMRVIAEGVETLEQEQFLIGLGCDEGQGYWYSKPLAATDAQKTFLAKGYL